MTVTNVTAIALGLLFMVEFFGLISRLTGEVKSDFSVYIGVNL